MIPDPDAILAELAAQASPAPPSAPEDQAEDEICGAYVALKKRVMARAGGSGPGGAWMSKDGIKRVRYSHEDCIDRILMTPGITQADLAPIYGVSGAWMTIVINSDAFKVKLAERRKELVDPALLSSLNERYGALAARSIEVLLEKLSAPVEKISDKLALEAAALGAKAMGLGEAKAPVGPSAVDHLASLAHRLMDLNRPLPMVVEAGGEGEALVFPVPQSPVGTERKFV